MRTPRARRAPQRRAGPLLAVVAGLALIAGGLAGSPAAGQDALGQDAPASGARLGLVTIPAWIEGGASVSIDLRVEPVSPGLEMVATVRERVASRSAWARTLTGTVAGGTVGSVTVALDGLSPGPAEGTHRLTIDLAAEAPPAPPTDAAQADPPDNGDGDGAGGTGAAALPSIPLTQEGVYPLQLELRAPGVEGPLDSLLTHLVVFNEDQPPAGLAVSWIWPLGTPIPRTPAGRVSPSLQEALLPDGRLAQLTDALAAVPGVPVTVTPSPATLDAWVELASTAPATPPPPGGPVDPASSASARLTTLRGQVAQPSRQVLASTYASPDLAALERAGLDGEIAAQLAEGADVLRALLGIRPDPRIYLAPGRLNAEVLGTLRQGGVDRLVVEREALVPVFEQLTPARPFEVTGGGRTFLTASTDDGLGGVLAPPGDRSGARSDAEIAQQLLSGLAVVALESPAEERGVVIVPPPDWRPSTGLLVAVMNGLTEHPALEAVTLDAFFGRIGPSDGDGAARALEPTEGSRLVIDAARIAEARRRIDALAGMLPGDAPEPAQAGHQLLLAESARFQRRGADPSASDYLAGVDGIIGDVLAAVRLPSRPAVTLTSARGRVPITLVNERPTPVTVQVRLSSDSLLFPDGETHQVQLDPRSTTMQFTVEARTSGSFPMLVEITSPDGLLALGSFEMTVRSTAVSGVALTITIGAGLFLAGWWGTQIRKARRRRREDAAADAEEPRATGPVE